MSELESNVVVHQSGTNTPPVLLHCLGVDHRFWDFARPLEGKLKTPSLRLARAWGGAGARGALYRRRPLDAVIGDSVAKRHCKGASGPISLGGLIAQHFAATYPEAVDRPMLIDTTPRYSDELRAMWHVRAETARHQGVGALVEGLLPIWFSKDCLSADRFAVGYVREALARTPGEGYALACEALAAADLQPLVHRIQAPTMAVCGDNDIPEFLDATRWLAKNIPNARLCWIEGARHASVLEVPKRALQLMTGFLLG